MTGKRDLDFQTPSKTDTEIYPYKLATKDLVLAPGKSQIITDYETTDMFFTDITVILPLGDAIKIEDLVEYYVNNGGKS